MTVQCVWLMSWLFLFFCDCYLLSHSPAPSHFLLSLSLFHSSTSTAPPFFPGSGPWHYPSSTTLPTGEPYRLAVSTGTPLLFSWMSPSNREMTWTKCMVSICTRPKKKSGGKENCHGWLNWNRTSCAPLITNKQWTLQIHKFAAKHSQAFVHFWCFGSITRGRKYGRRKRLRSADIWQGVIPVDWAQDKLETQPSQQRKNDVSWLWGCLNKIRGVFGHSRPDRVMVNRRFYAKILQQP